MAYILSSQEAARLLDIPSAAVCAGKHSSNGLSSAQRFSERVSSSGAVLLVIIALCFIAPPDITQFLIAVVGAVMYVIFSPNWFASRLAAAQMPQAQITSKAVNSSPGTASSSNSTLSRPRPSRRTEQKGSSPRSSAASVGTDTRQNSRAPVAAPTFESKNFEAQVNELLNDITPSAECDRMVEKLVEHIRCNIKDIFPNAEVRGYAWGNVACRSAFGVAVPEIDIVIIAPKRELAEQLRDRVSWKSDADLDPHKLLKSAIRIVTDRLVSTGGVKFRRSAFKGNEPKVTLMAPPSLGLSTEAVPFDLSVNSVTALQQAAIVAEAGEIDPRAMQLILLVKRWAKNRGICHTAKGNLSPHAWTMLVIYFLQVGVDGGSLLPPVQLFKRFRGQSRTASDTLNWSAPAVSAPAMKKHVADLFHEFVAFYSTIDWRKEAASVLLGSRAAADVSLGLHIVVAASGRAEVGPTITDPYESSRNLADTMTLIGVLRLREELGRAYALLFPPAELSPGVARLCGDLTRVLEPWMPPESVSH